MSWRNTTYAIETTKGKLISLSSATSDCAQTPDGYLYLPKDNAGNVNCLVPLVKSSKVSSSDYKTKAYYGGCEVYNENDEKLLAMLNKAYVYINVAIIFSTKATSSTGYQRSVGVNIFDIKSSVKLPADFKVEVSTKVNGSSDLSKTVTKSLSAGTLSNTTASSAVITLPSSTDIDSASTGVIFSFDSKHNGLKARFYGEKNASYTIQLQP